MNNKEQYLIDISLITYAKQKKPKLSVRILLTLLVFILIIAYVAMYIRGEQPLPIVIMWVIYGGLGLYSIYTGNSFYRIFGDAYVKINNEKIRFKPGALKKELQLNWDEITSVVTKPTYLIFKNKKGIEVKLPFENMEYSKVQQVKEILEKLLKEKGIEYK